MFHITKEQYLESILKNGLKVNCKYKGLTKNNKELKKKYDGVIPIFLTNDINYVIDNQIGRRNFELNDYCILEIDIIDIEIEPEFLYLLNDNNLYKKYQDLINSIEDVFFKTFICKHNIEPNKIKKIVSNSRKKTPIGARTCKESEKKWKRFANRKLRKKVKQLLVEGEGCDLDVKDVSNIATAPKDGKSWFGNNNDENIRKWSRK